MHRVGTRRKRFARPATIGGVAGLFAVHHIGGDGQNRQGGFGVAIGVVGGQLLHKALHHLAGDLVHAGIVVAERRIVAFDLVIDHQTAVVADGLHLGVFDSRQAVHHHAEARDAASRGAHNVLIVQRHLQLFIRIFVVHIVDDVQRVDIQAGEPVAHLVVVLVHLVVIQHIVGDGRERRRNLIAGFLVAAAVDGVQ